MTIKPVLAALSLWALATPALAQGTAAQRAACSPDTFRLCASHIPDVGAITACLRSERSRLSPACRTAMDEASPAVRQAEARPAARRAARRDERPTVRRAASPPAARVSVRQVGRVRVVTRTVVVYRDRPRHAGVRRNGYGGGSQMAQAAYWMERIGGMSERFGGPSIAGMMGMLQ
ncbi:hypothetical protein [uncultured Methylobacterium sp.]|uniref:hypothetical protein n=1 Tax=uncultured Methylobacterium sp. TaxID=157278 RepID=UPI0035CA51A8